MQQVRLSTPAVLEEEAGPWRGPESLPTCRATGPTARDKPHDSETSFSQLREGALRHDHALRAAKSPACQAPMSLQKRDEGRGSHPADHRSLRARPGWAALPEARLPAGRLAGWSWPVPVTARAAEGQAAPTSACTWLSARRGLQQSLPSSLCSVLPSPPASPPSWQRCREHGHRRGRWPPLSQPQHLSPAGAPGAEPGGLTAWLAEPWPGSWWRRRQAVPPAGHLLAFCLPCASRVNVPSCPVLSCIPFQ